MFIASPPFRCSFPMPLFLRSIFLWDFHIFSLPTWLTHSIALETVFKFAIVCFCICILCAMHFICMAQITCQCHNGTVEDTKQQTDRKNEKESKNWFHSNGMNGECIRDSCTAPEKRSRCFFLSLAARFCNSAKLNAIYWTDFLLTFSCSHSMYDVGTCANAQSTKICQIKHITTIPPF